MMLENFIPISIALLTKDLLKVNLGNRDKFDY